MKRDHRLSHDSIYNLYELAYQLKCNNKTGDAVDFVKLITLYPRLVVHLLAAPLLDSLKHLLNVSSSTVSLHYDTVFSMGDYYMSTITFQHSLFEGNPIIPCGFFIHSRRFLIDHKAFVEAFIDSIPPLSTKGINIITDQEFKFTDLFPVGKHLFCWNHMLYDLKWHLRNKCNCTTDEVNAAFATFRLLMTTTSEAELDDKWKMAKDNGGFKMKVLQYFEKHLLPNFKNHASVWALKEAGIETAESGVNNNPFESMNAVFHRLQKWKNVSLDVIVVSMYHLCAFYHRELERSVHQCGRWTVEDAFEFCKRDPALMPRLQSVFTPKDIVDQVHMDTFTKPGSFHQEDKTDDAKVDSRLSLAVSALND